MRVLVVHNPKAGSDDADGVHLIHEMKRLGYEVDVHTTRKGWMRALDSGPDLVAALGGDGTVGKVARAVHRRGIPIAVLPMGTANNVATWLGLTKCQPIDLISSWPSALRRPFDLGVARGAFGEFCFLESVGVGLLGETMAAIDEGDHSHVNEIGESESRIAAALDVYRRMILEVPARRVELRVDGADLSGDYVLVEALNFGAAGPNLRFAPQADASDGLLDLVIAEDADRHILRERLDMFRSHPELAPALRLHRGRRIELRSQGGRLHLDDELRDGGDGTDGGIAIELTIEPGAVTFLVPGAAAERDEICSEPLSA